MKKDIIRKMLLPTVGGSLVALLLLTSGVMQQLFLNTAQWWVAQGWSVDSWLVFLAVMVGASTLLLLPWVLRLARGIRHVVAD